MIFKSHKPRFYFQLNIKNKSGAETETFYHFMENISSFWLCSNSSQKKLEQGDVYQRVASLLLLTSDVNIWGVRRPVSGVLGGMLPHPCLMQDSCCSIVLGLCCWIFQFMMQQMFSVGERSGLQTGQSSNQTLLLSLFHTVLPWLFMHRLSFTIERHFPEIVPQLCCRLVNLWSSSHRRGSAPLRGCCCTQSCYWSVAN